MLTLLVLFIPPYMGMPWFRLYVGYAGCMWRLIGWPPKKPFTIINADSNELALAA